MKPHTDGLLIYEKGPKTYTATRVTSSINGVGNTGQLACERQRPDYDLTVYTETNSKSIQDLDAKHEILRYMTKT